MTAPVSPNDISQKLLWLSRTLTQAADDLARLDEAWVEAKAANEVAYARTFLTGEGTVDVRKQKALLDTADVRLVMDMAEAQVRAGRERMRVLYAQIDVTRSLGTTIRAELATLGGVA